MLSDGFVIPGYFQGPAAPFGAEEVIVESNLGKCSLNSNNKYYKKYKLNSNNKNMVLCQGENISPIALNPFIRFYREAALS